MNYYVNDWLDKYGDDWFAEGNEFNLVTENENMKAFREQWNTYYLRG